MGVFEYASVLTSIVVGLGAALENGDHAAFLLAVRKVIDALGGMTKISRLTGLNRENLYLCII